jgi:hypothetical protein
MLAVNAWFTVLYYSTVGKEIWGALTTSVQHRILSLAKSSDKTWLSKKTESLRGEFVRERRYSYESKTAS